jgi:uncharacterized protein (DUF697 family)
VSNDSTKTLLRLYDRFVGLLDKLPGGIQKPVLQELHPIRDLFLDRRPARIQLAGGGSASVPALFAAMGVRPVHTGDAAHGWREYTSPCGASISILDTRSDAPEEHVRTGLEHQSPDLVLVVQETEPLPEEWKETLTRAALAQAPVIGICPEPAFRQRLTDLLIDGWRNSIATVFEPGDHATAESLCALLPPQAQIEFAQFTQARRAQAYIASRLLRSFSAICGVVALQPIPLADLPVLLALQSLMVGLVIHTTGRPVGPKLIAEFLAALGLGAAAGFLFRETARVAVRIVPFWGNAVSGLVAGAGTYAIGRAAIAYFIDDTPLEGTRLLFKRLLRKPAAPSTPS